MCSPAHENLFTTSKTKMIKLTNHLFWSSQQIASQQKPNNTMGEQKLLLNFGSKFQRLL